MQKVSLKNLFTDLNGKDNFVFLETKGVTHQDYRSYLFTEPIEVISCNSLNKVRPSLNIIERLLEKGYFAAGFVSYEAGFAFEDALQGKAGYVFPLLWFGIYKRPVIFNHRKIRFTDNPPSPDYSLNNLRLNISKKEYINAVKKVKSYIEEGQTYQVNYTFKLRFSFSGSAFDLYLNLRKKQTVSYSALIRFGRKYIISLSPELFFRKEGDYIQVKPMKGTADRGRYLEEDIRNERLLELCPKNRSENIMIVDLLRNDLGRISKTKTVRVKRLFEVENYESILQMTSTIEGRINPGVSLYDLFKAIFPSGSVTGAPKIRTMQIIDELEKEPRRIYTGSIGFISPKDESVFNVAIRTLLIDKERKTGEMGIGSGVVYDSQPPKEYTECKLKAEFLTRNISDFQLIETILWESDRGYFLLDLHLERLSESAAYFKFLCDEKVVLKTLRREALNFDKDRGYRVRLLLDKEGEVTTVSTAIETDNAERLITFSDRRTSSSDIFLFHKTTNRKLYDDEYKRCRKKGFYDIIFQNEKGQITEGAISNIFIKKNNIYYTPPIECGLLKGVYRRYLMRNRLFPVEEKILYPEEIRYADEILLTNAIRKAVRVKLIEAADLAYA